MSTAAILFALTALGGGTMAAIRLSGRPHPHLWLALGHGALAAAGLSVLGYTVATQTTPFLAQVALGMFGLTAAGGFVLFGALHLQNRPLPIVIVLGHGSLAIASVVVLLFAALG